MTRQTATIMQPARCAAILAAAFMAAAGFYGAAHACTGCYYNYTPTLFQNIASNTETIRLGNTSAGAYYGRGGNFYRVAAGEHEDFGLSSRKEAGERALADLNEAVRRSANAKEPDSSRKKYLKMRGDIHLHIGNFALAAADYSEAIRLNPGDEYDKYSVDSRWWRPHVLSDGLYFAGGAAHYLAGAYGKAIEHFETARRTRVADDDFLAETAIGLAEKRLAAKGAAQSEPPPEAEQHYFRGLVYYNNYDTEIERYGIRCFEAALSLDTANAEYHRMLGLAHFKPDAHDYISRAYDDRYDYGYDRRPLAMRHFAEAIRLAPDEAKNYAARARALTSIIIYKGTERETVLAYADSSIADYTQAIRLAPHVPEYRAGRATAYLKKENYDKALADYLKAVQLDSGVIYRVRALSARDGNRGREGYSDGKLNQMLCAELKRLYEYGAELCCRNFSFRESGDDENGKNDSTPDTEEYHYNKAKKYSRYTAGEGDIAHYTELIRRFKKNAPYYARRAKVRFGASYDDAEEKKAVADYARAVELDSSFLYWDWIELAWSYEGPGNWRPNMNFIAGLYTELLRKSPHKAEYYYQRGRARTWRWRVDFDGKAVADFNRAIKLKPNVAAYHKALGDAYLRRGECEKAAASHLKAMRLDPNGIFIFLNSKGHPIKGYRAALEQARAKGGAFPKEQCPNLEVSDEMDDEETE